MNPQTTDRLLARIDKAIAELQSIRVELETGQPIEEQTFEALRPSFASWLKAERNLQGNPLSSRAISDTTSRVARISKALATGTRIPKGLKGRSLMDIAANPPLFDQLVDGDHLSVLAGTNDANSLSSIRSALRKFRAFIQSIEIEKGLMQ